MIWLVEGLSTEIDGRLPSALMDRCPAAGGGFLWGCADMPPILRIGWPRGWGLDGRLPSALMDSWQDDPTKSGGGVGLGLDKVGGVGAFLHLVRPGWTRKKVRRV